VVIAGMVASATSRQLKMSRAAEKHPLLHPRYEGITFNQQDPYMPLWDEGPMHHWEYSAVHFTPKPGSEKALQTMVGADVEIGDGEPWDPLGFSKMYDRNFDINQTMVTPHVKWLREAEIKHGRTCMLAFVGIVTQHFFTIPGYPVERDWIKALDLVANDKLCFLGLVQIIVFILFTEGQSNTELFWVGQGDREAGDLGWDPLKICKRPGFDMKTQQLKELKNGRLAMIGVASLAAEHVIPGSVPLLAGAA